MSTLRNNTNTSASYFEKDRRYIFLGDLAVCYNSFSKNTSVADKLQEVTQQSSYRLAPGITFFFSEVASGLSMKVRDWHCPFVGAAWSNWDSQCARASVFLRKVDCELPTAQLKGLMGNSFGFCTRVYGWIRDRKIQKRQTDKQIKHTETQWWRRARKRTQCFCAWTFFSPFKSFCH